MSVEVIPAGASAVVTDHKHHDHRDFELMTAIKDSEANLERTHGDHYGHTVKTIKDSEAELERSSGFRHGKTLETIKDSEANLDRFFGSRFAKILEEIKENEVAVEKAHGKTRDTVRQAEISVESAKARLLDTLREIELNAEKSENCTRSLITNGNTDLKNSVFNLEKELGYTMLKGFKDQLIEDKAADKDRAVHAAANALAFKELSLQQERLNAQSAKEAAACCCKIETLILSDGQKTRDLVNELDKDRLRERAMRAEQQISAYFAAGVKPVVP